MKKQSCFFTTGSLTFDANTTDYVELNGTTPGTTYDQLANRTFAQVEECREEMNLEECAR